MMEAMRILHTAYRNPKRTILVGHWSGEEQGLNGSRAFAVDHAEILNGLQVLLNQDSGTGRIDTVSMQGIAGAADFFRRWLQTIPAEIGIRLTLIDPGSAGGGSDQISFVCEGAPAFSLQSIHC